MGEAYVKGDFLANRGVPLIDDTNDLCPGNVGGQIVAVPFTVAITKTDTGLSGNHAGSTVTKFVPYKGGSVVGLSIIANTAVAKGWVTATVYKGATSIGFAAALTTVAGATTQATASQVKDTDTFSAGDLISIKFDLDASNTTNSALATLYVEL